MFSFRAKTTKNMLIEAKHTLRDEVSDCPNPARIHKQYFLYVLSGCIILRIAGPVGKENDYDATWPNSLRRGARCLWDIHIACSENRQVELHWICYLLYTGRVSEMPLYLP